MTRWTRAELQAALIDFGKLAFVVALSVIGWRLGEALHMAMGG